MSLTTKVNVAKFSFLKEKSYNKTIIDFNFGRHKDLLYNLLIGPGAYPLESIKLHIA